MDFMRFLRWLVAYPETQRETTKSNDKWLAKEEARQIEEVRERLERIEVQLEKITRRPSS